jgi:hypothetical protein
MAGRSRGNGTKTAIDDRYRTTELAGSGQFDDSAGFDDLVRDPTRTAGYLPSRSATIAGGVALVVLLGIGVATGAFAVVGVVVGVGFGALLAVSIAAVDHDRTLAPLIGGWVLLGSVASTAGLPVYLVGTGRVTLGGIVAAGALVGLGVGAFRIDAVGGGAVARAIAWVLRVAIVVSLVALFATVALVDLGRVLGSVAAGLAMSLLAPTTETGAIIGFVAVAWLALGALLLAIQLLPPAEVFPAGPRHRYQAARSRARSGTIAVLGGGSLVVAVLALLVSDAALSIDPVRSAFALLLESRLLRTALVRVTLASTLVTVAVVAGRSVGATVVYGRPAWLPSGLVTAIGLTAAAIVGTVPVLEVVGSLGVVPNATLMTARSVVGVVPLGLIGAVVGLFGVGVLLSLLPLAAGVGILPAETAGPRLAVFGLVLAAAVVAIGDGPAVAAFAGVVGAVVVWDVAEYGVGLTADVGVSPAHRDGEFNHAGASFLVAVVAFGITVLVSLLLGAVTPSGEGILVGVTLAAVALLVMTALVRG